MNVDLLGVIGTQAWTVIVTGVVFLVAFGSFALLAMQDEALAGAVAPAGRFVMPRRSAIVPAAADQPCAKVRPMDGPAAPVPSRAPPTFRSRPRRSSSKVRALE